MKKYIVYGVVKCTVTVAVEARSEKEALAKADEEFGGVMGYVGNGGSSKLVGVSGEYEYISCDDDVKWDFVGEYSED